MSYQDSGTLDDTAWAWWKAILDSPARMTTSVNTSGYLTCSKCTGNSCTPSVCRCSRRIRVDLWSSSSSLSLWSLPFSFPKSGLTSYSWVYVLLLVSVFPCVPVFALSICGGWDEDVDTITLGVLFCVPSMLSVKRVSNCSTGWWLLLLWYGCRTLFTFGKRVVFWEQLIWSNDVRNVVRSKNTYIRSECHGGSFGI